MLQTTITLALGFIAGLIFGSFLNVCIVRLPQKRSIVHPRSRCLHCGNPVPARDNIPLLSYVLLGGRCRHCKERISWRYPAVEALTGLWFLLSFVPFASLLQTSATADALLASAIHSVSIATLGFLLLGLCWMDWETGLLPNEFTIGGLAAGVFFTFCESFFVPPVAVKTLFTPEEVFIAHRLGAAAAGFFVLWAIGAAYRLVRRRQGVGGGDPKLLAMIGSFLGFGPLLIAFLAGTLAAGIFSVVLLLTRRGGPATRVRYGSFLAVGGLLAAVWGDRIAQWYLALFR